MLFGVGVLLLFYTVTAGGRVSGATLSSSETIYRSDPYCAGSTDTQFQPSCGNAVEVIAVESIQHGTKLTTTCGLLDTSAHCCQYDSGDCLVPYTADGTSSLLEDCSGKQVCSGSNPAWVETPSCGSDYPDYSHYYTMAYYCLPGSRISETCLTVSKTVTGNLLYLKNQEYPHPIKTDETGCTCSIEAKSCDSQINVYILHLDLSNGTPGVCNPNQKIIITDRDTTHIYTCSDDNNYVITKKMASTSNYITVQLDNPDGVNDGHVWIGFEATHSAHELTLDCPAKDETPCLDCGHPASPTHGAVTAPITTYNSEASYSCNTGYHINGAATRTCQRYGTWSGIVPTCVIADCGIPNVPNGISLEYSNGESFIRCNTGYYGGGNDLTCKEDGTWEINVSCDPIDCGAPTITNGQLQPGSDDTFYDGTSVAMCNAGYEGGGVMQCQADGSWTANPDPCTPIDCSTPSIDHASFSGDTFYTGTPVVTCDAGYDKTGTAVCQTDGSWILPTCNAKDCGPLNIANGVFSGTTVYDGSPSVTCNTGYDKVGTAVCESTGSWTAPTCDPKDCGDPGIANSILLGNTVFDGATYINCNVGYTGSGSAECLNIGIWNPATLPTCTPKDCGHPASPTHGAVTAPITTYSSEASYSCNTGYYINGVATRFCQADGLWDGTVPMCVVVDCGHPASPTHGAVTAPITTYSSEASYSCNTGYYINGATTRTCQTDGTWSGIVPTCVIAGTGSPGNQGTDSTAAQTTTTTTAQTTTAGSATMWTKSQIIFNAFFVLLIISLIDISF